MVPIRWRPARPQRARSPGGWSRGLTSRTVRGCQLCLPRSWTTHTGRCAAAKLPQQREFAAKDDPAEAMVRRALASPLRIHVLRGNLDTIVAAVAALAAQAPTTPCSARSPSRPRRPPEPSHLTTRQAPMCPLLTHPSCSPPPPAVRRPPPSIHETAGHHPQHCRITVRRHSPTNALHAQAAHTQFTRFPRPSARKTPGQRPDPGSTVEPPSGFEPETYALRGRERVCLPVPARAAQRRAVMPDQGTRGLVPGDPSKRPAQRRPRSPCAPRIARLARVNRENGTTAGHRRRASSGSMRAARRAG